MFRALTKDEIQVRVASVAKNGSGASLLLYKDARVDMNILDEAFGVFGWQRYHEVIDGNLYCTVSVKNPETGEWVSKSDVGTESNTEEEKGQSSDSFKRACFNWGIGRELYTAPFVWVKAEDCNINNNKLNDKFSVQSITIEDGVITALTVYNDTTRKVVFDWKRRAKEQPARKAPAKKATSDTTVSAPVSEELKTLQDVYAIGQEKGYTSEGITVSLVSLYGVQPDELTAEQIQTAYKKMQSAKRRGE